MRDVLVAALCAHGRNRPGRSCVHGGRINAPLANAGPSGCTEEFAISGAIGVYHAGVEAKIFEGFTQCTALATTKGASTAELLKEITHAPLVRCDEVQFRFLGISMAGWNAILSLGGAALILILNLKAWRR